MNYILSPDKEIHSFDGVLANDSDEGSCRLQGKLVLIGGLVKCELYLQTKVVKFKTHVPWT